MNGHSAEQSGGHRPPILLICILVIAAILRLRLVLAFPFEQDELYTLAEATDLFQTRLQPGIEGRPLYYLLQHPLLSLFPASPPALRLLPFVFGMLGVWVTYRIGRWIFGRDAGLVAALVVALSPWHVHASAMARYWSLVYLLSAGAYFALVRAYEEDRSRDWLAALLLLVAGTLTHPSFVFPMVGAVVGVMLVRADGSFGWRWPTRSGWTHLWLPFAAFLTVDYLALRLAGSEDALRNWGGRGLAATLRLVPAMVEWMTPTVFVAGAIGAVLLLGSRESRERRWATMSILGVLSAVSALVLASFLTDTYADYAMAMLPLVFVSAGGLVQLGTRGLLTRRAHALAWVASALLLAGVLPTLVSELSDGTRFDYRQAFRRIAREAPGLPVLTWPEVLRAYYAPALQGRPLLRSTAYRDSLLVAEGEAWAVVSEARYGLVGDDRGELADWLARNCRSVERYERPRLDYRVYRVELFRCSAGRPAGGEAGERLRAAPEAPGSTPSDHPRVAH